MKKIILLTLIMCLFLCPIALAAYPVDIQISDDQRTIKKIYEFDKGVEADISRSSFELNGLRYTFVDFICEDVASKETFWAVEPVKFTSKTNDINSILSQLDKAKDVSYENGFAGTIPLNLSSIRVESMGTGKSTRGVTQTRTYPNLASADLTHIPKTLDYNGKTLNLTNVQWKSDNTATLDHRELTDRYSCVATYGGTATSTYSKGYMVYADYQGEITKNVMDKTRWTAIFSGSKQLYINYWWFTALIPFALAPLFLRKRGKKS